LTRGQLVDRDRGVGASLQAFPRHIIDDVEDIRRLLIHGARSCMIHLDRSRDLMGVWLNRLDGRMHRNKAIVALANKIARIAWTLLRHPHTLYERIAPANA
jgi:transposase